MDNNEVYILKSSRYNINEGSSFIVDLKTKNVEDDTLVPFIISGVTDGTINNQEIYSNFHVINNSATLKFQTNKNSISNNEIFVLKLLNEKASVGVLIKKIISTSIITNPKVSIQELVVIKPGLGYTSGDTVTDGTNTYYPIISPVSGAIVSIKPITNPMGSFSTKPIIYINTTTGVGAKILPVVSIDKTSYNGGIFNNKIGLGYGSSVINVVDCI
jgi:hypothetical protein